VTGSINPSNASDKPASRSRIPGRPAPLDGPAALQVLARDEADELHRQLVGTLEGVEGRNLGVQPVRINLGVPRFWPQAASFPYIEQLAPDRWMMRLATGRRRVCAPVSPEARNRDRRRNPHVASIALKSATARPGVPRDRSERMSPLAVRRVLAEEDRPGDFGVDATAVAVLSLAISN
jgi:hypothetical protein